MKFELRAESSDFLSPVYVFEGDETVDFDVYKRCITSGYVSSVCTLAGAAESFGIDIDAETFERWKRMGSATGLLDDFLDESPDRVAAYTLYKKGLTQALELLELPEMSSVPKWADERLLPSTILLANSVAHLPAEQLAMLVEAATVVGDALIAKITCDDITEYIRLLKQEALATSVLIHASASLAMRAQPGFEQFSLWCKSAMELGTLADCARDIRADERAGLTRVGGSVLNSAKIAFQLRRPIRAMIHPRSNLKATSRSLIVRSTFYRGRSMY